MEFAKRKLEGQGARAGSTGAKLGNIAYHVKTLLRAGLIEEVSTQSRRGALERFYRAVGDDLTMNVRLRRERAEELVARIRKTVPTRARTRTATS